MDDMYQTCLAHMNRRVRVHTRCGECYEGVIVNVDNENVYLRTSEGAWISAKSGKTKGGKHAKDAKVSGWFGPGFYGGFGFGGDILALSLFTLLAIALI